ncbi:SRPBCC family protein [Sporosarcina cyprini]|uniref:SRPBCC family protein n=1 Tax=Sporosarcina cyprini TaxID=2910523 RepID=UPI001EE01C77|nr:SRPBCC family protein [Sporosarcina cyprini]MCG3089767.1 SRPBCC family protein [Sporosarcina cyprini]
MDTRIVTKMKIQKRPEDVFEALVDPAQMSKYWFSSGTHRMEPGKTIIWRYEEYNAEGKVHVKEVEKPRKIQFVWGEEGQETTVTISLEELGDQTTLVTVEEEGLSEEDPHLIAKMLGQKEGWVYMLTCLKGYVENGISSLRASLVH